MARETPEPEEVFYNDITRLIKNLLINNPNYTNDHYWEKSAYGGWKFRSGEFLKDTQERAEYILERIEQEKHLINLDKGE